MKIRLNAKGWLYITRRGKLKEQYCPSQDETTHCGDWCPLFREVGILGGFVEIRLCQGSISCLPEHYTDEREV